MRRRRWLALLAAAACAPGAIAMRAEAQPAELVGTLAALDTRARTLSLTVAGGERRIRFDDLTLFVVAGRPGAARDLRPGQRLRVQLQVSAGGRARDVARRVVAISAAGPG
ncbi:MAG: hypothetical protein VYE22_26355 [Myxococcota bacterium]|nr:hypothetical protein [Myxococcota bacterium]